MRIAHITDLHVARPPAMADFNAKRILGYANFRLFRSRYFQEALAKEALVRLTGLRPDVVLLTGDITQHGLEQEFDAAEELLSVLTEEGVPVIAVPGNHDIYGRARPERLHRLLESLALDRRPGDDGVFRFPGVEILPLAQGIHTLPFFAHGKQDRDELERAAVSWSVPASGCMRLVCGHYPVIDSHGGRFLYFRGLREADSLVEFCRDHRVAAYFCGHDHKRFHAEMPGGCIQYVAPALPAVTNVGTEWIGIYECGPGMDHPVESKCQL